MFRVCSWQSCDSAQGFPVHPCPLKEIVRSSVSVPIVSNGIAGLPYRPSPTSHTLKFCRCLLCHTNAHVFTRATRALIRRDSSASDF